MAWPDADRLLVPRLGGATHPSPLQGTRERFVEEAERVLVTARKDELDALEPPIPSFEMAGPRRHLAFAPATVRAGIVTCGGLCPGLNDVIRSITLSLHHDYGVEQVLGFRYGYAGLRAEPPALPIALTPDVVDGIHKRGGTLLGSSRGPQDLDEMSATLRKLGIDMLFAIGGDGTLRGASALSAVLDTPTAVIGVPKTIDNDLVWTERSFGFATAVEAAQAALEAAHTEAQGAWNGVGLVKLMGRHSGFIAASAALANGDVNICLVPEVPVDRDAFLAQLETRLRERRHALVVVAEGAGQDLLASSEGARDASGNLRLGDIGTYLRDSIRAHFTSRRQPVDVKYIDPSYTIRSCAATSGDASFGLVLGQHAVHAAMAGRTDMMVGYWNHRFTHVPLALLAGHRKTLDPDGELWQRVMQSMGPEAAN